MMTVDKNGRVSGVTVVAAYAKAAMSATHATPRAAVATRIGCHLRSRRDNVDMPGVSQALVEFANHHRQPASPGIAWSRMELLH